MRVALRNGLVVERRAEIASSAARPTSRVWQIAYCRFLSSGRARQSRPTV